MSILDYPRARVIETSISFVYVLNNFTWWTKRGLYNFPQHGSRRKKWLENCFSSRVHKSDHKSVYSCKQSVLLEQQWSKGRWNERLARRVNVFHWKNSHSQVKMDKLSSTCLKVLCQMHRLFVVQEIRSHQRADDKFLSQHWHSPDITAVKEMPWATSLGWILN